MNDQHNERELKPCPFCGNEEVESMPVFNSWGVQCNHGCVARYGDFQEDAEEAWNTRTQAQPQATFTSPLDGREVPLNVGQAQPGSGDAIGYSANFTFPSLPKVTDGDVVDIDAAIEDLTKRLKIAKYNRDLAKAYIPGDLQNAANNAARVALATLPQPSDRERKLVEAARAVVTRRKAFTGNYIDDLANALTPYEK